MPTIFIPNHPHQVYGLLIIVALLIGEFFIYKQLRNQKAPSRFAFIYCLCSIISIYIFSILANLILFQQIGLASVGAAAGIILCAFVFERYQNNPKFLRLLGTPNMLKLPKQAIITSSIIALPLLYSIAKLACLSASCCHGINYNGPFSVHYEWLPEASFFPIQLLETIVFLAIFLSLARTKNQTTRAYATLIICITIKLLLDFLRYYHETAIISANQIACLAALILLLLYKKYWRKIEKILSHRI